MARVVTLGSMLSMPTFPNDWPEGCPPDHAEVPARTFYRIVMTTPPTAENFRSFREMGKHDRGQPCEAAALSVFTNPADARHYSNKFPYLGDRIAGGDLTDKHGLWAPSPRSGGNSHASWWVFEALTPAQRAALFMAI